MPCLLTLIAGGTEPVDASFSAPSFYDPSMLYLAMHITGSTEPADACFSSAQPVVAVIQLVNRLQRQNFDRCDQVGHLSLKHEGFRCAV